MLFHHVSENRLELKRRRVTGFFFLVALLRHRAAKFAHRYREVCRSPAEVKKRRVETRTEWKRFPNFLTKTIKRCKQRVDGGAGAATQRDAMYRDDISARAVRYLSGC